MDSFSNEEAYITKNNRNPSEPPPSYEEAVEAFRISNRQLQTVKNLRCVTTLEFRKKNFSLDILILCTIVFCILLFSYLVSREFF